MRQLKHGLMICAVLLVVGCASSGGKVNVPVVDTRDEATQNDNLESQDYPVINSSQPSVPSKNTAVVSLLKQATRQHQNGNYVGTARTLERAIRISPRYGELYYRLSEVRFGQRNFGQSEQLCRKAISLASGDSDLLTRSRLLMAKAKQAQGDH